MVSIPLFILKTLLENWLPFEMTEMFPATLVSLQAVGNWVMFYLF